LAAVEVAEGDVVELDTVVILHQLRRTGFIFHIILCIQNLKNAGGTGGSLRH
jgi:hypothetical protein